MKRILPLIVRRANPDLVNVPVRRKRQTVPTLSLFFKVGTVVSTVKVF